MGLAFSNGESGVRLVFANGEWGVGLVILNEEKFNRVAG